VSLEGPVNSEQDRELAQRIARNTEGVVEVDERLSVAGRS
jgi:osmotically-inducible protein OsmY